LWGFFDLCPPRTTNSFRRNLLVETFEAQAYPHYQHEDESESFAPGEALAIIFRDECRCGSKPRRHYTMTRGMGQSILLLYNFIPYGRFSQLNFQIIQTRFQLAYVYLIRESCWFGNKDFFSCAIEQKAGDLS
jgi:hypothetical protein